MEKNSLNNFICHLSFFKKPSPTHTHCSYPFVNFQNPYELLFLKFESLIKGWMWIGKKIHSIISSATCHSLRNLLELIHIAHASICKFSKPYELLFLEFESFIESLNVNSKNIHSIILSVTCHCLRNHCPTHTHPSYPFVNFQNPMSYYFLSFESLIKCWMWIGKNSTQ